MYSINVIGYIPTKKSQEFKQHISQLISQHGSELLKFNVSQDVMNEDLYQVKASFYDKESMFSFIKSKDYEMISGSFKVLGMLREQHVVEYSDFKEGQRMLDD